MEIEGTFAVRAPREKVFTFLVDPRALSNCVTDPHTLDVVDEDHFRGQIRTGVGFIQGTFTGRAEVVARVPPERASVRAHGTGMGNAVDIEATMDLSEADGLTTVRWKANVAVSGTIASIGARLIRGTIDRKANEFFENVRKKLEGA